MNDEHYELAAILATHDHGELYSGLSVLVSTAVEGAPCAALAAFGALHLLLDPELEEHAASGGRSPKFARSLAELRDTALDLDGLTVWACAASVDTMGLDAADRLAGVMSTPRFLRQTAAARRFIHV